MIQELVNELVQLEDIVLDGSGVTDVIGYLRHYEEIPETESGYMIHVQLLEKIDRLESLVIYTDIEDIKRVQLH